MSKTVYVLLCWLTFIPAMLALTAGVFWLRDSYGLVVVGPMAIAVFVSGWLLHRWETKHGSMLAPRHYQQQGPATEVSSATTDLLERLSDSG